VASSKKANILIRKGRVIDPANGRDEVADLLIENGRLVRIGASLDAPGADIVDAEGHWVLPGLVDACVHLSLPGSGRSGDIASETRAAAAGGITHLVAQPDCGPVDSTAVVRLIREQAGQAGFARIMPIAAMTQGLAGDQLAEMATLAKAGCIAVGNAGRKVAFTASESFVIDRHGDDFRALIEEASDLGAGRALERLGLSDRGAEKDVRELRELLSAWRDAKKAARGAVIGWIVRIGMALLLLGVAVKVGLIGLVKG